MKLDRYFKRIGFHGDARPTISTLTTLLRCHVCSVPFENIDVQLGRQLTTHADESAMSAKCEEHQNDFQSLFVLNLVVQRRWPDKHVQLRGRVLTTTSADGEQSRLLETADELAHTVSSLFGLDVPGVAQLWPAIVARHGQLFGS